MRTFLFITIAIASFMASTSYASQQGSVSSLSGTPVKARLQGISRLHRKRNNKSTSTGHVDTVDTMDKDVVVIDASQYINLEDV